MCGLAGVFGNLQQKDLSVFKDLFYMAGLRGIHSSGVAMVGGRKGEREASVMKSLGAPSNLFEHKPFDNQLNTGKVAIIGHARHATIGVINTLNAHPFDFGDITGCHNGTLRGNWRKELGDEATDSRALIKALQYNDPKDLFQAIDGAWAVSWYDAELDTFNLVRNSERPLLIATVDKGRAVFYASEAIALEYALRREGRYKEDEFDIRTLTSDHHYRWVVGHGGILDNKGKPVARDISKPKVTEVAYSKRGRFQWGSDAEEDGPQESKTVEQLIQENNRIDTAAKAVAKLEADKGVGMQAGNVSQLPVRTEATQEKLPFPTDGTAKGATPLGDRVNSTPTKGGAATSQRVAGPFRGTKLPYKNADGQRLALDGDAIPKSDFELYNVCVCSNALLDYDDPKIVLLNAYEFLGPACMAESTYHATKRLETNLAQKNIPICKTMNERNTNSES